LALWKGLKTTISRGIHETSLEEVVAKLERVGEEVVLEACSHFSLVIRQIKDLQEAMDRLQLTMGN